MNADIHYFTSLSTLSRAAAELLGRLAAECIGARGVLSLALSGGSTPRPLHELLARPPYTEQLSWDAIHLFWGDDRAVPPDHADSNFAMACETLIDHVPIPPSNVHPIPIENASPEETAAAYEHELRTWFAGIPDSISPQGVPIFDVMLLGMGPDGHTASLFPGSPVLDEEQRWVSATPLPLLDPPVRRVTMTLPVINAARNVLFLIAGQSKYTLFQTIVNAPELARPHYPAARIAPQGQLYWYVQREAIR